MHQCEAMWISLRGRTPDNEERCAVKISAGGINALTGAAQDAPSDGRQNYVTLTGSQLDGQRFFGDHRVHKDLGVA